MTLEGIKSKAGALESLKDKKVGDQNQIIYLGKLKRNFQLKNFSLRSLPTAPINKQLITRASNEAKNWIHSHFTEEQLTTSIALKRHPASIKQNFIQTHAKLIWSTEVLKN